MVDERPVDQEGYVIPTHAEMKDLANVDMHPDDWAAVRRARHPEHKDSRVHMITEAHNVLRRKHCVDDIVWDDRLAQDAQNYADELVQTRGCEIMHNKNNKWGGENLAWLSPAGWEVAPNIVQGWYDEKSLYDFDNPAFSRETGHFSQVVSSNTKRMGCAVATCSDKQSHTGVESEVWVCNYDPPGNILGHEAEHVKPLCNIQQQK